MLRFADDIVLSETTLNPKRHGSSNRLQRGTGDQPAILGVLSHHVYGYRSTNTVRYCASPSAFHAVPGGTRDKQATQANGDRAFLLSAAFDPHTMADPQAQGAMTIRASQLLTPRRGKRCPMSSMIHHCTIRSPAHARANTVLTGLGLAGPPP